MAEAAWVGAWSEKLAALSPDRTGLVDALATGGILLVVGAVGWLLRDRVPRPRRRR